MLTCIAPPIVVYKRFSEFQALRERCDERTRVVLSGTHVLLVRVVVSYTVSASAMPCALCDLSRTGEVPSMIRDSEGDAIAPPPRGAQVPQRTPALPPKLLVRARACVCVPCVCDDKARVLVRRSAPTTVSCCRSVCWAYRCADRATLCNRGV
jgi:hypothetical protein